MLTASIHHWEIRGYIENLPVRVPTIFIYQEVKIDNKNIHAYVSLFDNTSLDIYKHMYYIDEYGIKDIHPATSEQCNLLWQKMREAGYKWDPFAKETIKSSFKVKETLLSAADRGIIDEIILALGNLGAEKMISYDREIKFLERIRKL